MVGADLTPEEGWRKIYDSPGSQPGSPQDQHKYSPHYNSYQWAVYLWGYGVSGKAKNASFCAIYIYK
jgi:hypothetical protein